MLPPATPQQLPITPPLYSDRAIRVFSVLFSAIVGGVLAAQNLKDLGQPGAARKALWGSIGYTVLTMVLSVVFLPERSGGSGIAVAIGFAGGYGLTAYSDKILGDRSAFPTKSVWKPLLICLLIFIPIIAFVFYAATL